MEESLAAFVAVRMKIAGATLVDMNKNLIYDDVGIAIMQYALDLCAAHFNMEVQRVNASSSVNFISTLLNTLPISDMLDWNGSGKGFVQKPDAVFQISFAAGNGTMQSMLVYYESDAGSKANEKDRKQAARKMYQSTCGCRAINPELPAISVRANVFVGPEPDLHLAHSAAAELNKVQRSAQNALDFLHSLTVAHLWFCCQLCLLVRKKGTFNQLVLNPELRVQKKYDIHCLIGMIHVPDQLSLQFFEAPHVTADVRKVDYNVAGAARIQCLFIERFNFAADAAKVRTCLTSGIGIPLALHGMPTVQDMWMILRLCDDQAVAPPVAVAGAAPAVAAGAVPAVAGRLVWAQSGARVVGLPGAGLSGQRVNAQSFAATATFDRLETPNPVGSPPSASWILGKNVIAEYYDAMCAVLHTAFFENMMWIPVGTPHHSYILDLKKLKAESKRDVSVLKSREQTTGMLALGMENSLGFTKKSCNQNLSNICMQSLFDTLPSIDTVLDTYIASFHAPNIALFLRLIRCTNLLAFEHLAKTNQGIDLKDAFQKHLRFFPVGTAADLDYIMQHTINNAKNVHSIYLKPSKTSLQQSANVTHSTEYAWVCDLLKEVSDAPLNALDRMLPDSPLYRKFLLCHKTVYKMFHSIVIVAPLTNAAAVEPITERDTRAVYLRIIRALMQTTIMHYIDAVQRHVEVDYATRQDENRNDIVDNDEIVNLRAFADDAHTQEGDALEDDDVHGRRKVAYQFQFTRLTWPLRDLNIYTRISTPVVTSTPSGHTVTYPGNRSFCNSEGMHAEEEQIFDFMQALQERDDKNRQSMEVAFDTDTVAKACAAPAVPPHMQAYHYALSDKQSAMQNSALSSAPRATASRATAPQILMAWRWKTLLIKTTLLSALNGICHEFQEARYTPHHIESYSKSGPESSHRIQLILNNFEFIEAPALTHSLYKPLPTYWVCMREFKLPDKENASTFPAVLATIPPGAFDHGDVNLLDCTFGIRHSGRSTVSKLVWRTASMVPSLKYSVKKRRVYQHEIANNVRNRCITAAQPVIYNVYMGLSHWYDFA